MNKISLLIFLSFLVGCTTLPRKEYLVKNLQEVPDSTLLNSLRVKIFTVDNPNLPTDFEYIDEIFAYSCKRLYNDPPASKGDALKRLKIKAYERGANAVIEVTFDTRGTDPWGLNCWEIVQASGLAVKIQENN